MTVKQLIELLKTKDENLEVLDATIRIGYHIVVKCRETKRELHNEAERNDSEA